MGSDVPHLSGQLLDAASGALRASLAAHPEAELERTLQTLVDEAVQGNPGIDISPAQFLGYLAERLPATAPERALAALKAADLYLACGCVRLLPRALAAFDSRVLPRAEKVLRRQDPSESYVDEVMQLLRQKLLVGDGPGFPPKILEYEGRGPIEGWVRAAAIRVGLNSRRGQRPELVGDEALLETPAEGLDPEMEAIRRRYHADFKACFHEAMGLLPVEDRNMLRLHLLEGAGVFEIAGHYRVHRTTITRRLAQSRNALVVETRRLLVERLRLTRSELDAMVAVLRSQLDLSISRVLREGS
ncbi:MAG: RNA polymerase subunit sigma-70 [Myxococcaceae bacterium]